jgi:GTP-binding protein HflX
MNRISKSKVLAENKLFATLDTTVRKVSMNGLPFLLSDTVGFIRKLPHHLIECFKSTLAEAQESDILLHVVDAAHPHLEDHITVVKETLRELGITDRPVITVFNKIDLLEPEELERLKASWHADENAPAVFLSARSKENMEDFRNTLTQFLVKEYEKKSYNGRPHHFLQQYQYYNMQ